MFKMILQLLQVVVPVLLKKKEEKSAEIIPFPKKEEPKIVEVVSFEDYITASGSYPERMDSKELTEEKVNNAYKLLDKINPFLIELAITEVKVSSGFRTLAANKKAGGASKSLHMECLAVDVVDEKGELKILILENLDLAKKYNLYVEDFRWSVGWVHLQCKAPTSKRRIFVPSTARPTDPKAWNGIYDKKFDG